MLPELWMMATMAGCRPKAEEPPEPPTDPAETPPTEAGRVTSRDPRVTRKRGDVLVRDLAEALWLDPDTLCTELGTIPCEEAHRIALGGVDPYVGAIYEPLPAAIPTTMLASERIALQACEKRVTADLAGSPAVLGPVLASDDRAARERVVAAWVDRLLRRSATPAEIRQLADFWDDVGTSTPVRDGALWTCFVVATSVEQLFY